MIGDRAISNVAGLRAGEGRCQARRRGRKRGAGESVIGSCADLAALERRVASLTQTGRAQLDAAAEAQRSHFLSDGSQPEDQDRRGTAARG